MREKGLLAYRRIHTGLQDKAVPYMNFTTVTSYFTWLYISAPITV